MAPMTCDASARGRDRLQRRKGSGVTMIDVEVEDTGVGALGRIWMAFSVAASPSPLATDRSKEAASLAHLMSEDQPPPAPISRAVLGRGCRSYSMDHGLQRQRKGDAGAGAAANRQRAGRSWTRGDAEGGPEWEEVFCGVVLPQAWGLRYSLRSTLKLRSATSPQIGIWSLQWPNELMTIYDSKPAWYHVLARPESKLGRQSGTAARTVLPPPPAFAGLPSPRPTSSPALLLPHRRERHHHRLAAARGTAVAVKVRMRRQGQGQGQGQYGEADYSSMVSSQLHQYQAQQRVQQHPDNSYPGRDPGQAAGEHHYYTAPKVRQSQWDRGGPNIPNQIPQYSYNEGQGAEGAQSFYERKRSDFKVCIEKQPSKESKDQSRADRTEPRYGDYNQPPTFEGLEQNFHEDIIRLSKELYEAEDAENTRHRERLNEINAQYQEKLLALRARQVTSREEFLRKESLERQKQYQQASMSNYANNVVPGELHSYPPAAANTPPPPAAGGAYAEAHRGTAGGAYTEAHRGTAGGAYGEAHRGYASGQYESFGERPDYPEFRGGGQSRDHAFEHRGQYPGGRAYNSGGRRF